MTYERVQSPFFKKIDVITFKSRIKRNITNIGLMSGIITSIVLIYIFYIITFNNDLSYFKPFNVVIIAPISFLLIIALESYKSKQKEFEMMNALNNEIFGNFENLEVNRNYLNMELDSLKINEGCFSPLFKMHLDMYDVTKQLYPKNIAKMGYPIEKYIYGAHKFNDTKKAKEQLSKHKFIDLGTFISATKNMNNALITYTNEQSEIIRYFFENNGKILEINESEIKSLRTQENFDNFLKLNKLNKNLISIDLFKESYNKNVKKIVMLILYH